jgi:hypothetical protein
VSDSFTCVNVTESSGLAQESALGARIKAMLWEKVKTFGILWRYLEKADAFAPLDLEEDDFLEDKPKRLCTFEMVLAA